MQSELHSSPFLNDSTDLFLLELYTIIHLDFYLVHILDLLDFRNLLG